METKGDVGAGPDLSSSLARFRSAFIVVGILSAALNFLLIGGSIYLMLVYDSVLPSRSLPTLAGLFAMVTTVYLFQGLFEQMRHLILSDLGASLDRQLATRVQTLMSAMALKGQRSAGDGLGPMRDLDAVRNWLASGGPAALIDLPWIVFFLLVVCLFHWLLAATALVGALVLVALTLLADRVTRSPMRDAAQLTARRNGIAETNLRHVEVLTALGMHGRMRTRWNDLNRQYVAANRQLSGSIGMLRTVGKVFRLFLQSAIITVGALLVISEHASAGVIFASSILTGRALAPVDQAISGWRGFGAARAGWSRLKAQFSGDLLADELRLELPLPCHSLTVSQVFVAPPGTQRLTVSAVDFHLEAGDALGVIGPSAAGKTSLARALIGIWQPLRGSIRLDGATLDQWDQDRLGQAIGYLPQSVELLEGSVAENIARFDPEAASEKIFAAARAAGVHDLVVALPDGYETQVGSEGQELSAGQRQRIGLARALYGEPFLVVLDEPNSNLDEDGDSALETAIAGIRKRGCIAVIIAHRPSALAHVSHVLFLRGGRSEAFGPRDEVLQAVTRPASPAATASGPSIGLASAYLT